VRSEECLEMRVRRERYEMDVVELEKDIHFLK
jgi:hypothetical protein